MQFREIAKDYYESFGFNLLPLENKVPKSNWEKWQAEEMLMSDIDGLGWNEKVNGIGAISGINKLRCLDFDKVNSYEIVKQFVRKLGLPSEYQWIVKSGSGKGYHIWFYCDDDSYIIKVLSGDKSYYKLQLKENGLCDHIELRWKNCQTVLPPSFHPSGKQYEFIHPSPAKAGTPFNEGRIQWNGLPSQEPLNIGVGKLIEVLKEFCVLESESNAEKVSEVNSKDKKDPASPDKSGFAETSIKDIKNKIVDKRFVKDAAEFLNGKIDNYDEYLRIGFALASLGEEGREFFLLIGKDNPKYPEDTEAVLNKKFDSLLKDYRGNITLGTFFEIAKKFGFTFPKKSFWHITEGKVSIIRNLLIEFLEEEGFGKIFLGKDYIYIQVTHNIVREVTTVIIKDFVLDYVNEISDTGLKSLVREIIIKTAKNLFSDATLECLKTLELDYVEDGKDKVLFFFKNCFVVVTETDVVTRNFDELKGCIWERQLIKRDFVKASTDSDFKQFVKNVCRNNEQRINALKSAIGFLLHSFKDPACTKAIIFLDEKLSDNAYGRSGKGLIAKAISNIKNVLRIDGKNFRFDKSFPFQSVSPDTQIILFDDVTKKFGFEKLFSIITEGITIEKKNKNEYSIPFERTPKIIITTNHSISGSDDSSTDRQFLIEFSDFYNAKHKPKDDFGKLFFDEWDAAQWTAFDNFMIECCQYYLKNGLKEYEYVNLIKKKLIDETAPEFEEFIKEIPIGKEHNKKELFESFKRIYEDFGQMKQNSFSKWIKVYAELYDLKIDERKSGADRYITFRKKTDKAEDNGQMDFLRTEVF
ncbi:MAG: bifunctional DNA primase/polymerase [Bacteroidota bacterium]